MEDDLGLGRDVSSFLSPRVAVCGLRLQLRHVMSSAACQVDVMVLRESWTRAALLWRVMVLRESWTYAALLRRVTFVESWLSSSHGLPRVMD